MAISHGVIKKGKKDFSSFLGMKVEVRWKYWIICAKYEVYNHAWGYEK